MTDRSQPHRTQSSSCTAMMILVLLVPLALTAACNFSDPASPNSPTDLEGNNPNQFATFNGVILLGGGASRIPADGLTDVLIGAQVLEPGGNPVPNGTRINFFTDLGTVRPAGADPTTATDSVSLITFEGRAAVAVRSIFPGTATVTAVIADVASRAFITFDRVPLQATLDLTVDGTSETVVRTAPIDGIELKAVARALDSSPLAGVKVRFFIQRDNTASTGDGPATLGGPPGGLTNSSGEAVNTLFVTGVGTVTLLARLLDPVDSSVVQESNQVQVVTTETNNNTAVTLQFDDGSTTTSSPTNVLVGLSATVTDTVTNQPLRGVRTRFRIVSDTATAQSATLSNDSPSRTDESGIASNSILGLEANTVVVIEAQVIDDENAVVATSNQISMQFTEGTNTNTVALNCGTIPVTALAGNTVTCNATVNDMSGQPVAGAVVQFRIVSDTGTTATWASTTTGIGAGTTGASGVASDGVTATVASTVVVIAELLDSMGAVVGSSQQVGITFN